MASNSNLRSVLIILILWKSFRKGNHTWATKFRGRLYTSYFQYYLLEIRVQEKTSLKIIIDEESKFKLNNLLEIHLQFVEQIRIDTHIVSLLMYPSQSKSKKLMNNSKRCIPYKILHE